MSNIKTNDTVLDIAMVQTVASRVPHVHRLSVNHKMKVISFLNDYTNCRFVVYEHGTIAVTAPDPIKGTVQSVHRNVNYRSLVDIFQNPLKNHYPSDNKSIGAKRKSDDEPAKKKLSKTVDLEEECEFDEPTVKTSSSFIKPTHLDGKRHIIEIEAKKAEDKRWSTPTPLTPKKPTEEAKVVATELSRKVNARGNNCFWKLRHKNGFPPSVHDVACLAMSQGGFAAVMDDGTCVWDGIPAKVVKILESEYRRNVSYMALGECGQHYILMKNGREYYSGPPSFEKAISGAKSTAKVVAFGDTVSYFVQFEDGTREWNAPFPHRVVDILKDCRINSLWIGTPPPGRVTAEVPYFVSYQPVGKDSGTVHSYAGLPHEVSDWIECKTVKSTQIKQILTDGDCFVIRYS